MGKDVSLQQNFDSRRNSSLEINLKFFFFLSFSHKNGQFAGFYASQTVTE